MSSGTGSGGTGSGGTGSSDPGSTGTDGRPGADAPRWFAFRYGLWRPLMTMLGGGPGRSSIVVDRRRVAARMGRWFSGQAPTTFVTAAREVDDSVVSRGVHGWSGDWLVNGAGDGLVEVLFDPPMSAHVIGVPVKVRRLRVSVEEPAALVEALRTAAGG